MIRGAAIGISTAILITAVVFSASDRDSRTYSRADVVDAFAGQGFTLMDTGLFESPDPVEALFAPVSQEPFFVYVGRSDRIAKRQFADYERLKTPETFQMLRGNVIAISDSGLRGDDRNRVRAAMRGLVVSDRT